MARILLVLNSRCDAARTPHTSTTSTTSALNELADVSTSTVARTPDRRRRRPHFFPARNHAAAPAPDQHPTPPTKLGYARTRGGKQMLCQPQQQGAPLSPRFSEIGRGTISQCEMPFHDSRYGAGHIHTFTHSHIHINTLSFHSLTKERKKWLPEKRLCQSEQ